MNKEEIEHKLEQAQKDRQGINDNILWLKEQLAEAEKPKLRRHGDFGINKKGNGRIRIFKCAMPDKGEGDDYSPFGIVSDTDFTSFGNIFDLLKEWSEDLRDFKIICNRHNREFYAQIEDNEISLQTGRDKGEWCWTTLPEAEEIWRKLGQMIANLKRRQK